MSGPATYSFGADAVRYGSDLSGQNSAYFLQQSGGTAVVPADLLVKGDLQVDGTSALVGALTVGTPSASAQTTLNGNVVMNGSVNTNGNVQNSGNNTVGGAVTILGGAGPGGIGLTVGQSGAARDLVVTGTSNMGTINGSSINLAGGLVSQSNSSFLANILVSQGIYGGNSSTAPLFPLGALMASPISQYPITSGGDATYPYYFISIGKLRIAWGASAGAGGCQFPYGTTLPFNFATSTFSYASLNSGVGQPKRYICNVAGTAPNYFSAALLDSQTNSTPSETVGFNCIMVGAVA
jgi:hypothetical protein